MKAKNFLKLALVGAALAAGTAMVVNKKLSPQTKARAKKTVTELTGKILKRLHLLKSVSKANYEKVVEAVLGEYQASKKLSRDTVKELRQDLKSQWKNISKELGGSKK
ncbi:MAG: hypothetical protein PHD51_00715 [Patescibacteria group bacterium]|nr:hypothetical protein [Patescibacteria group bacterium]MDD5490611.1 hypothetical protein [Patescibacteria group bacterium]